MTLTKTNALTATALLAAGLLTAGPVLAQSMGGGGGAAGGQARGGYPPQEMQQIEVDDATLEHFIEAFQDVQQLNQDLTEQMSTANSTEEAQAMQREVQDAMVEVVESSGISIAEYNEIASGMRYDPILAERVMEAVGDLN